MVTIMIMTMNKIIIIMIIIIMIITIMENKPKAGQSLSSVKSVETSNDAKLGQETIKGNEKLIQL
jgi:hypothetical protein